MTLRLIILTTGYMVVSGDYSWRQFAFVIAAAITSKLICCYLLRRSDARTV